MFSSHKVLELPICQKFFIQKNDSFSKKFPLHGLKSIDIFDFLSDIKSREVCKTRVVFAKAPETIFLRVQIMTHKRLLCAVATVLLLAAPVIQTIAISPSEKSRNDYVHTLENLRYIRIIVQNFATDEQIKQYDAIQDLFKNASIKHYAQDFVPPYIDEEAPQPTSTYQTSHEMFMQAKFKIVDLLELLTVKYLERTQTILDSTSKKSIEVIVQYGKTSNMQKYFTQAVDPLNNQKTYDPKDYHYYRDKETIERYLKKGYKRLQDARVMYSETEFAYIKSKKNKTNEDLDFLINRYTDIIECCRQAKQYGIEIHKLFNPQMVGDIVLKYKVALTTIEQYPIYDDRIPEEYKLDANDNRRLVYKVEKERMTKTQR